MPFAVSYPGLVEPIVVGHARECVVYVNEHADARQVRVAYRQAGVAAPRGGALQLVTAEGQWVVAPGPRNQAASASFAGDLYATLPTTAVYGFGTAFRLSGFGNDRFTVRVRFRDGSSEHVDVVVRKRVAVLCVEMARGGAGAPARYSVLDYRPPGSAASSPQPSLVDDAMQHFESQSGVEIVLVNRGAPREVSNPGVVRFRASQDIIRRHPLPAGPIASSAPGRAPLHPCPERAVWLIACGALEAERPGGEGGRQAVFVSASAHDHQYERFRKEAERQSEWFAEHPAHRGADGRADPRALPEYVQFQRAKRAAEGRPLSAHAEQLMTEIWHGRTPEQLVRVVLGDTIIHEFGHAFGLVPWDERAGAVPRAHWRGAGPSSRPARPSHCADPQCRMYATAQRPFAPSDFVTNCLDYLRAADLRHLDQVPDADSERAQR